MSRRTPMQRLARWHIWLGWAAALPIIVWLVSGLIMVARPIEVVRGENLRAEVPPVNPAGLVLPKDPGPIAKIALVNEAGTVVWIVTGPDKSARRFGARNGELLGPVVASEAHAIAAAAYSGQEALTSLHRIEASQAPLELRRERPAWQAEFADETHLFIDADSGEVLALRTGWWRTYDFFWGLHIMDPMGRENAYNPFVWLFGALGLVLSLFGAALLFRRRKARPNA
jgi:hypothetical protein